MRSLLALALAGIAASADPVVVLTDVGWKGIANPGEDWMTPDFDDSGWAAADSGEGPAQNGDHYSVRNTFGFDSKADWLWAGEDDGCAFRRSFEVPAGFRRAEMIYFVDDVGELYVNGELADNHLSGQFGHRGAGTVLDLLPWLREGANVIALRAKNIMGPRGFAAEIRIDGAPFFVPSVRAGQPLAADVIAAVKEFAKHLDADDEGVREAAETALLSLARRNGLPVVEAVAKEVEKSSAEAKARAAHLREALHERLWQPAGGPDSRWAFAPCSLSQVKTILESDFEQQWSLLRMHVLVRARMDLDPAGMLAILSGLARDGEGIPAERAVRVLVGSGLPAGADVLREVLKSRPDSRAGAFAAAGLARFGSADDIPALENAAVCGHAETERAAKAAARILKK
ncbi:MAG: hypothetical protein AAB074_01335 [Planctomycetota bacterium]